MFKRTVIATSVALAITALPAVAQEEEGSFLDEWEIAGELKNESAVFTKDGQTIGQATTRTDTTTNNDSGDAYKSESTARIFINGDVGEEGSSFHAELNLRNDGEATSGYKGSKSYTQHDVLRELYVDTEVGDEDNPIAIRAGKQQVVWGTADGIKLLDIINPTDWREFAQNTMEDSRIPVWMVNAETDLESGGNVQFILSQAEENKIPGLGIESSSATTHTNGDQGQPFIMKGVDTITGKTNGFMNLAPAMGSVARFFSLAGGGQLSKYTHATVSEFVNNQGTSAFDSGSLVNDGVSGDQSESTLGSDAGNFFGLCGQISGGTANTGDAICLHGLANDTNTIVSGMQNGSTQLVNTKGSNNEVTNLIQSTNAEFSVSSPDTVFEYMDQATFATFESFVNLETRYKKDYPSDSSTNSGLRFKDSTDEGLNWSVNYFYHYDANPYVDLSWHETGNSKGELTPTYTNLALGGTSGALFDYQGDSVIQTNNNAATTTVTLNDSNGNAVANKGRGDGTDNGASTGDVVQLLFTEKLNRIHSLGGALDYAIDTETVPVVLRGEFLYDKDVKTPVIDRAALNIGDLTMALKNEDADFFKYVIGADVTVMTNLMLSGQFIQYRNLDYIDETGRAPTRDGVTSNVTGARYTGDMATLHLSNGLNKAEENKEFYSFFMSKPFGNEQQHRWNNIFMYEENGGKWNRLDVEYSFNDEIIGTAEYNKYWGDANTQFGQMEKSSNFQLGLKYIF